MENCTKIVQLIKGDRMEGKGVSVFRLPMAAAGDTAESELDLTDWVAQNTFHTQLFFTRNRYSVRYIAS